MKFAPLYTKFATLYTVMLLSLFVSTDDTPADNILAKSVSADNIPAESMSADNTHAKSAVPTTMTVDNEAPVFSQDLYRLYMLPGTDGSDIAQLVGTVTTTDTDGDPLSYSLRGSDPGLPGLLYMVGNNNDALYAVDITTGAATRVGSADEFGAGVTDVGGLARHNGRLYLVGGSAYEQDGIYTVNTTTGVATRAARLADFGVGYRPLTSATSHGGMLYAASSHFGNGRLFRIDLQAGTAAQLGYNNFGGINENAPSGLASHDGKLYMVGTSTDRLYEIDTATGAATAVGSSTGFDAPGGGEESPSGLVSDGTTLYMTGDGQDRLYVLDTATGAATPVGSSTDFGVSEDSPQGIAIGYTQPSGYEIDPSTGEITYTGGPASEGTHILSVRVSDGRDSSGDTDHSVDAETAVIVTVANQAPVFGERGYSYTITSGSDGSVDPVVVGTPSAVDPEMQTLTYSLRASDPADRMYMLGDKADALYALDSTTGAATERVGTVARYGVGETDPRGLTWHNGRLYMTGDTANSLYTIDTITGEATRLTSGGVTGSLLGVVSHDGELYVTTSAYKWFWEYAGRLYRVDLDTSTFTQIGNTNLGVAESWPKGLASHGSPAQVYMLGTTNNALYTLDTDTGVAVRVGTAEEFGVGEHYPFGLASHNGVLYMTGSAHDALYTLDTVTGEATRIGAADEFDVGEKYPSGLASGYREPEGFAINSTTGEITYTGTSATSGTHTLYAQVTDNKNSANTADTAVDDTARITITIPNQAPTFTQNSYEFNILPGTDGTDTAQNVGTVTTTDIENDPVSYTLHNLSASGSSEPVYMAGDRNDALYTVDITTGAAARVGSVDSFGTGITDTRGLGWHNGELYLVGGHGSEQDGIYTVNTTTGVATRTARLADFGVGYRPLTAITSHSGTLYATSSHSTGRLFKIDLQAGTVAQVGDDDFGSVNENAPSGLASHDGKLYMVGTSTDKLYEIDAATGAATAVGSATGFDAPGGGENSPSGLVSHGTTLYMTGTDADSLYTLNTTTGTATPLGTFTGPERQRKQPPRHRPQNRRIHHQPVHR